MDWVISNWAAIAEVASSVVALATTVTLLTPTKWDDNKLAQIVRIFSLVSKDKKFTA